MTAPRLGEGPHIGLLGAGIGAAGSTMAVVLAVLVGVGAGGLLGIIVGSLCGAVGSVLGGRVIARGIRARLDHLFPEENSPIVGVDLAQRLDGLAAQFDELRRARARLDAAERTAMALLQADDEAIDETGVSDPDLRSQGEASWGGLLGLLEQIRQAAELASDDADALDGATRDFHEGVRDQSSTVDRATTTVEGLCGEIDQISRHAESAAEAARDARVEARRGLEQVQALIEGVDHLRAHAESNGRQVRRLGDRSEEIGAIVDLIGGISARTDMLALNATIESIRAGVHDQRFSVVAEEIRKLAERASVATRDIGHLVEAIQSDTHETVGALTRELAEVDQEAGRVREAGAILERLRAVADRSAGLAEGISRAATGQAQAVHELVRAVQRISEVNQRSLDGSGRARERAVRLVRRCARLRRLSATGPVATSKSSNTTRAGTVPAPGLHRRPAPVRERLS